MSAVTYASIEASIYATFITQPFWVIKTRMLLEVHRGISEFQNFLQKTKEIYIQNGIRGFGKGLMLSLILSLSGVIQMYIYEASKVFYDYASLPQTILEEKNFICGSISKAWGVLMTYPITTVRTRIQQNQYFNNRNDAKYHNAL
jgi:solute carrier family 25 folate transporter 32